MPKSTRYVRWLAKVPQAQKFNANRYKLPMLSIYASEVLFVQCGAFVPPWHFPR